MNEYSVQVANYTHIGLADQICQQMEESAKARGTGIAKRSPDYLIQKMLEGKAIIATDRTGRFVGFCYVETWGHGKFVANSGLIVHPEHRKSGVAKRIKEKAFELSRTTYPLAKIFGLTTSLAVMKINSSLGYQPVTFSELTDDEAFWKGCSSCVNYDILNRTNHKHCLCTGMLFDPAEVKEEKDAGRTFTKDATLFERWLRLKERILTRRYHREKKTAAQPEEAMSLAKLIGSFAQLFTKQKQSA
ncbi:MAG: GNAT family N-acetyltransferase [Ferruginibacter sp.]|nr:GNAT family N-acetyltransferase [Cytophagales bacterium]